MNALSVFSSSLDVSHTADDIELDLRLDQIRDGAGRRPSDTSSTTRSPPSEEAQSPSVSSAGEDNVSVDSLPGQKVLRRYQAFIDAYGFPMGGTCWLVKEDKRLERQLVVRPSNDSAPLLEVVSTDPTEDEPLRWSSVALLDVQSPPGAVPTGIKSQCCLDLVFNSEFGGSITTRLLFPTVKDRRLCAQGLRAMAKLSRQGALEGSGFWQVD